MRSEEMSSGRPLEWPSADGRVVARSRTHVQLRLWLRRFAALFLAGIVALVAATAYRITTRKYYLFLNDYIRWARQQPALVSGGRPTHVFFLLTDHFEPDWDADRVAIWAERYAKIAAAHRDSDGRPPQHTWFFPAEQASTPVLDIMQRMTAAGWGEVELHYHHSRDTSDILAPRLRTGIAFLQKYGFIETIDGRTQFAFIHGNFGLDNGNGPMMCGVNDEIRMLRELGCFADFSFPSLFNDAQPATVNSIYAVRDDPAQPKSYDVRLPLSTLRDGSADLMLFEGPLIFSWSGTMRRLFVDLDDGDIHPGMPASPLRVDRWIRANVHVEQRPDWVFVKTFAHGASTPEEADAVLGLDFDEMLTYLERHYNDGRRYVLHYVTARQAYNLARAAADGKTGEPEQYLNWIVPPYRANAAATRN